MTTVILTIVATVFGLIPSLGYMIRYHVLSEGSWRDHETGRHLMAFAGVISVLLLFILFNNIWLVFNNNESYSARPLIGLVLYVVFTGVLWRQWLMFEHAQHSESSSDDPHERT